MVLTFAYLAFSAVVRLLIGSRISEFVKTSNCSCCDINSSSSRDERCGLRSGRPIALFPQRLRGAAAGTSIRIDRHAADATALASRTRAPEVDGPSRTPGRPPVEDRVRHLV
jgi:hypothetical protein